MATLQTPSMHLITFCEKNKKPITLKSSRDKTILETAEAYGLSLPYCCGVGSCSACVGKLLSGTVNHLSQSFLDTTQVGQGYVLTCVAYPTSNLVIQTHQEDQLY